MLTPEQRATREAEEKARKEHDAEAARKEQEETRKNKALLSTYGSEKDIEVARTRALADNQSAVKQTQDRIAQIQKVGDGFKKELEFYSGKTKPPAKLTQDIQNNAIDLKAQQDLMAAKKKEVDGINARYDEDKRRYLELTKGPGAFPAVPPAPSAKK